MTVALLCFVIHQALMSLTMWECIWISFFWCHFFGITNSLYNCAEVFVCMLVCVLFKKTVKSESTCCCCCLLCFFYKLPWNLVWAKETEIPSTNCGEFYIIWTRSIRFFEKSSVLPMGTRLSFFFLLSNYCVNMILRHLNCARFMSSNLYVFCLHFSAVFIIFGKYSHTDMILIVMSHSYTKVCKHKHTLKIS